MNLKIKKLTTVIPRFLRIRTSQFCKFVGPVLE